MALITNSPFDLRLPQLPLVKKNSFKLYKLSKEVSLSNKVWPKTFSRLWQSSRDHRLLFKSFEFYVPFQRFFPFPSPTHGSFFRIQTHIFVYWYEFHSRHYCALLEYGTKEKKLVTESFLWLRQGYSAVSAQLTFWSFFQRSSTYDSKNSSLFSINTNNQPLYFMERLQSARWFEDSIAEIRLFSWNFYSRLRKASLPTILSQASFDSQILRRQTPWISSVLWLSSPIQDQSVFINSFFPTKSVMMPEMFFQFYSQIQVTAARWSQLFFSFWSFSKFSKSFRWSEVSFVFFLKDSLSFYGKSRFLLKLFKKINKRFFLSFTLLCFFKNLNVLLNLTPMFFFKQKFSTVLYESKVLPLLSLKEPKNPSKPWRQPSNVASLFPDKTLYFRYLRRQFFLTPSFVNSKIFLEQRLRDLNFFFILFFQSFSLNKTACLSQIIYLWSFCLSEILRSSSTPGVYARWTPNSQRSYVAFKKEERHAKAKEFPFVQAALTSVDTESEFLFAKS